MRSSLRRSAFFFAATLLHLGLFALLPRERPRLAPKVDDAQLLWIETPSDHQGARSASVTETTSAIRRTETGTGTASATGTETASVAETTTATGPGSATGAEPATSASSAPLPTLFVPDRAGIGLDGPGSYRVSAAREGDAGPPETEAQRLSELTRESIVGPIRAHDLANGGFGGPAVVALQDTARHGLTPNFGRAVFAIEVDALGMVIGVGVEEAPPSDRRQWEEIAAQSRAALVQKRMHLPPGAKGAHIRVEVSSRIQMPSGSSHPVTVTSPVVDGVTKLGSGEKAEDLPAVVKGTFDVSDIGAHPMRVVGARELSENVY
ncbi:MAG TPA: hypothetical protein VLM85_34195 [Polyangiaceae bacterium]|nr:hypothetical protein [Polyangiaceae bacterium]